MSLFSRQKFATSSREIYFCFPPYNNSQKNRENINMENDTLFFAFLKFIYIIYIHTQSQNHRMVGVGRDQIDHLVQPP